MERFGGVSLLVLGAAEPLVDLVQLPGPVEQLHFDLLHLHRRGAATAVGQAALRN